MSRRAASVTLVGWVIFQSSAAVLHRGELLDGLGMAGALITAAWLGKARAARGAA